MVIKINSHVAFIALYVKGESSCEIEKVLKEKRVCLVSVRFTEENVSFLQYAIFFTDKKSAVLLHCGYVFWRFSLKKSPVLLGEIKIF